MSPTDLQQHLRRAVALEWSTVPLYLYAYYSLEDELCEAAQTIRAVVMQEMAHVCLAANVLVAVGGTPDFDAPDRVPRYPTPLALHDPPLVLHLAPASVSLIRDTFCAIERPMTVRDVPESGDFTTIGQFYAAIAVGLRELTRERGEHGLFVGQRWRQLTTGYHGAYAGATGELVDVHDLQSALAAIQEIVHQGEGTARGEDDGEAPGELAHFWLFNQIADRTVPLGSVRPVITDPSTEALPVGSLRDLSQLFDDAYGLLLRLLSRVWTEPDDAVREALVATMVPLMVRVLKPVARILTKSPIPGQHHNAGPAFAFSRTPQPEVVDRSARLEQSFSALRPVTQALVLLPDIDETRQA